MAKAISGRGWFIYTVSGLVAGDKNIVVRHNVADLRELTRVCTTLATAGFARQSRRGWWTAEHPVLGLLQWRSGYDFRSASPYFFLRVNGKLILDCWPDGGGRWTSVKWVAPAAAHLEEWERRRVERFLGDINRGTAIPQNERE